MAWQFAPGEILTATNLNAVTIPWNAICQLRMSTPQSLTNNTSTALSFDTEDLDPRGWHAGGSPTLVTPTVAGWYRATMSIDWQTDTDYTRASFELQKNEANCTPRRYRDPQPRVTTGDPTGMSWPLVSLNGTTDRFRIVATQVNTSTGANTVDACLLVELVYPT
jgi:hypothetical protein